MIKNLFLVFVGGGFGSVLRYAIGLIANKHLPYGTFVANVLGCLLIGILLGLFEKHIIQQHHLLLLVVGFCGGFTTFSSFAAENIKMVNEGNLYGFLIYLLASIILGFLMVFIGFKLSRI